MTVELAVDRDKRFSLFFVCFISLSLFFLPPFTLSLSSLSISLSVPVKRTELLFHRSISAYLCVMEVGRQLFSVSDTQTQLQLQTDLAALQEDWEQCQCILGKRKTLTSDIIKVRWFLIRREMGPLNELTFVFYCLVL